MNKKLAKISKAHLEIKERGILNFWIHVDYEDGLGQGIGGIVLDAWCKDQEKRIGTAYGCEIIRRLLLELNVNDFSEMSGKHIWVLGEGEGFNFKPTGVQSLKVDKKDTNPVIFLEIAALFGVGE